MTISNFSWRGVDHGREALLVSTAWMGVLGVLARHEGENLRSTDSHVYEELSEVFPEVSWTGQNGDRPFFRDYARPWTSTGVLLPNADTEGALELTEDGRTLVENPESAPGFFRDFIDSYVEKSDAEGGAASLGFSPFALIAECLNESSAETVLISELQAAAETRLIGKPVPDSDPVSPTNRRRFKTYLVFLENAGAIDIAGTQVSVQDEGYLGEIGSDTEAVPVDEAEDEMDSSDHREFETRTVAKREGQRAFAADLFSAYDGACCVTGTRLEEVLEAAHILPYRGRQTNEVRNGLLLAVDIHRMFDRRLLGIRPDHTIELAPSVSDARYESLGGLSLSLPDDPTKRPSPTYLSSRFDAFLEAIR